jgi:VWFA-related protein
VSKSFQSFLFLLVFAVFSFAQTAPKPTPTPAPVIEDDGDVIKVNSRLVTVPVSVTDLQGAPVTGLKVSDFRLLEESRQQTLDQLNPADEVPLEIALMIDISSSVDPMFDMEKLAAAKFLRDVMRPSDRASIFTVGSTPYLLLPRDTAERAGEKITAVTAQRKSTAFYDSLIMAADYLQKNAPPTSRKVIVIISDGDDSSSEVMQNIMAKTDAIITKQIDSLSQKKLKEILMGARTDARNQVQSKLSRTMQNGDVVFYSLNPAGNSYHLNVISQFGQETMKIFADQTGGAAFLLKKPEDLDQIFRQLTNELRAQYLLQYYTDSDYPVGKYVNLQVSVPGRPTGVRVRARQGYYVK